jgi:hypothetical protein
MLKWATIFSTVMVGATMLSAVDGQAFQVGPFGPFRGSKFGHFTHVYRLPNSLSGTELPWGSARGALHTKPPVPYDNGSREPPSSYEDGYKGPPPRCQPNYVWSCTPNGSLCDCVHRL